MLKSPGAKRFWRLLGPVFVYWLIDFFVKFAVEVILLAPHVQELAASIFSAGAATQEQMAEQAMIYSGKVIEILMPYQAWILTAGAVLTVPYSAHLFLKDRRERATAGLLPGRKPGAKKYLCVAGFGAAACIGLNCLLYMAGLAVLGDEYIQTFQSLYSSGFAAEILCFGIIVPFAEELMFRGILFRRFRDMAGFFHAAVFASLLFGFFHGDVIQISFAFIIGMFLAYAYEKFGTIAAAVLLHVTVNVTSIIMTECRVFDWLVSDVLRMSFAAVLCAFAASAMFVLIRRADENQL